FIPCRRFIRNLKQGICVSISEANTLMRRPDRIRRLTAILGVGILLLSGLVAGSPAAKATRPSAALIPDAGQYVPISPVKVLDTTDGTGGVTVSPLASSGSVNFQVTGVGAIPDDSVAAVFAEITVTGPTSTGCIQVSAGDATNPGICEASF